MTLCCTDAEQKDVFWYLITSSPTSLPHRQQSRARNEVGQFHIAYSLPSPASFSCCMTISNTGTRQDSCKCSSMCYILQVTDPTCSARTLEHACRSGHSMSLGLRDAVSLCSTSVFFWDDVSLFGALGIRNTRRRNNKVDLKLVQYTHSETKAAKP